MPETVTVALAPDEVVSLFDAPAAVGYELCPGGKSLPAEFVAARRAKVTGRNELTFGEIALLVGVTKPTVAKWRKTGQLEARYTVINGKRAPIATFDAVLRKLRTAGYTAPVVRETKEQATARGRRETAALLKKLGH